MTLHFIATIVEFQQTTALQMINMIVTVIIFLNHLN